MRKYYQIFILIFLLLSFYIAKDDIFSSAQKVLSVINKKGGDPIINLIQREKTKLLNNEDTPGALRVVENLINIKDYVILSKDEIINFSNKYREENKLSKLTENQKLNLSAEKKLDDMFNNQYFEHASPNGLGVGDLVKDAGYEYILVGENLAMGNFKDDLALVDAWMASPGHRANILNNRYTEIGVAVKKAKFEGRDIWMSVQHFGVPSSACLSADELLNGVIDIKQSELRAKENDLILRREMIEKGVIYEGKTQNEQIDIYNNLVNIYNNLINEMKEKINIYNEQIKLYNSCVLEITTE